MRDPRPGSSLVAPAAVVGWDIGGVNTKAVRLAPRDGSRPIRGHSIPCEVQRHPGALQPTLAEMGRALGVTRDDLHAVTMTAELSQAFRTKREGVGFVLDALEAALPGASLHVYTVRDQFVCSSEARLQPLAVAAANWVATACLVAQSCPSCILMDIGTTTTDLIPIVNGKVVAQGSTDPERLLSGELVYTGALRTPVEAVARLLPLWGGRAGVSADGFAIMGDVHIWLGHLRPEDYTSPTPDGRPATRSYAAERLARTVCADHEMLAPADIDEIAKALADAQIRTVVESLARIRRRWPPISAAVVTGLGDFIAEQAARRAGLTLFPLPERLRAAGRVAPAAAVAWLLSQRTESARPC